MKMKLICLLLLASSLGACVDDASNAWNEPLSVEGPFEAQDRVVYLNKTTEKLVILEPTQANDISLDVKTVSLSKDPGRVAISADGLSAYVVEEDAEQLRIVDLETGSSQVVELAAAYDRIAVDPHGEFVVLSFDGSARSNVVARNLNEVGVVDLTGSSPETYFVTLSTFANTFIFADPFEMDGQRQRLMAVLSNNEVTVFDLLAADDDDRLREVPLSISEAEEVRVPNRAVFDVSQENQATLYLTSSSQPDVSRVNIQMAVQGQRKLALSTDKLTAETPADIEILNLPNGTRLVSASRIRAEFTVVDVVSDVSVTFQLPMQVPAEELIPFTTVIEDGGEQREETRVLAYSSASTLVAVIRPETIAIEGDEPILGRSVEAIRLNQTPSRISLSPGQSDQAIVFHPGIGAGFSLLNLAKNNDIPIQGGSLRDVLFDGLFTYVVYRGLPNLTIFADDGHPTNFDLPNPGKEVFLDRDEALVLVEHESVTGKFTVLDANDPTPKNARHYEAVFLDGIFEEGL